MAGNLREMVKGKTKGLDGVEFKFLGMFQSYIAVCLTFRYAQGSIQTRGKDICFKASRSPKHHREPENF